MGEWFVGKPQSKAEEAGLAVSAQDEGHAQRLYRKVAARLMAEIEEGRFQVGGRMPAERDLAVQMGVSRPVIREALLALEVMGIVEVKIGSGAYILRLPDAEPQPLDSIVATPIELVQARLMFEGEVASLAAVNITDEELEILDGAVMEMGRAEGTFEDWQNAISLFHLTMSKATRNPVVERGMRDIWKIRASSPDCQRMLEQVRQNHNYRASVAQHVKILAALKARNPEGARAAIKMHLEASIQHVLKVLEEIAVADARARVAEIRSRYLVSDKTNKA